MRNLNVMLLVSAFVFSSFNLVNANTNPSNLDEITKEIRTLLKSPSFGIEDEIKAFVTFTLNKDGEIVVLSVDSDNETVEGYIKSRLNYKKVEGKVDPNIKTYKVPVRLVK